MSEIRNRILVVDDETDIVAIVAKILEEEGYEIIQACNGAEALDKVFKTFPDLVILDMNMPVMSGMEFYYKIYNPAQQKPTFPVLAATARGDLEDLFRELNVDGYMTKPIGADDLIKEVNLIFQKRYGAIPAIKKLDGAILTPKPADVGDRILLVDEDAKLYAQVGGLLVGYSRKHLLYASTAIRAMSTLLAVSCDAAFVNTELPDMATDNLICKLKQMPRTMDVPIVLYNPSGSDSKLVEAIFKRTGFAIPVMKQDAVVLAKECRRILRELEEARQK